MKSGSYLLYDCACGTGGMLTVAEETLRKLSAVHGQKVETHLKRVVTEAVCDLTK